MNGSRTPINLCRPNLSCGRARRGAVMGLLAVLLPVLAILAAFCINTAQMQLTRTELMVATDAAARAGGRAFSETQTVSAAKTAAATTAAMNLVNGEPLQLRTNDSANEIEFGETTQPNGVNGRYVFVKIPTSQVASGQKIASALRVMGRRDGGGLSGSVPLVIPGVLNASVFETVQDAVAMQVDRDISVVLDRSGSMETVEFDWPYNKSPWSTAAKDAGVSAGKLTKYYGNYYYANGVDSTTYQQWAWEDYYGLGPAPMSPWQELVIAVDAFLDVLDTTSQEEQVSVASYSSSASLDCWLEKDFQTVRNVVNGLNTGGSTAIGKGMQSGIQALLASDARPYASKTMVVMTDGIHNSGIDPETVASELMGSYNLTIHTVTFGDGADQDKMEDVAQIGGGKHYHAASGAELVAIFEEIANNLPTIITE
ncbi:vWA domain-containing protein [Rubripirellula reticaptiva]|uniref:von Willebrand factor type A domain protein n=1 Tax=Rubripirellula reticaptiva TaxID=2528013 RepID=A0A5C6EI13_9BACT|nr:vWA domain-containing protein [Rubripirellula reticaptiva]TWU49383.1 von Willebrand factor type A domain protein [Rubripirellula reticaptiva]